MNALNMLAGDDVNVLSPVSSPSNNIANVNSSAAASNHPNQFKAPPFAYAPGQNLVHGNTNAPRSPSQKSTPVPGIRVPKGMAPVGMSVNNVINNVINNGNGTKSLLNFILFFYNCFL